MSNKRNILIVGTGVVVASALAFSLAKTADTADKLDISLDSFSLKSQKLNGLGLNIKIPKIIFDAELTIHNPTDSDLTITEPYLKVFYQKNESPIAHSTASKTTYTILAKQATPIHVNVEFNASNVIPLMPDFIKYMIGRMTGKQSTRKVKVDMLITANGIATTQTKEVSL